MPNETDMIDDENADGDEQERDLKATVKAYVLAAYVWLRDALGQSVEEIAPQLRSALSGVSIPSRAYKPLGLAAVLLIAAVAMPAVPMDDGTSDIETTEEPVVGTTYDAPEDGEYRRIVESALGTAEPDAPDPPSEVRTSAGSQTMNVETTVVDGEPAIVLDDDRTHDGRWVSIETSWFEEHVGEVPSAAYVDHEENGEYAAPITVREDSAVFYVREFSTNTVTFAGEVVLSGSEAADGTQFQYELNDTDGVDDPSINLTGVENTGTVTESGSSTGTKSIEVSGTPQNAEVSASIPSDGSYSDNYLNGGDTVTVPSDSPSTTYTVSGDTEDTDSYASVIIDINGNTVDSFDVIGDNNGDNVYIGNFSREYTLSAGDTVTVSSDDSAIESWAISGSWSYSGETTFSTDTGSSVTVQDSGSKSIPLSNDVTELSVSHTGDGLNSWSLTYDTTVKTRDPVVEVNGYTTSYDGTLADGETTSVAANSSWLQDGTNRVNISTNSPSSGPASLVGFEYSHGAETTTEATVEETTWSQTSNVSNTWPSDRSNASATIPMNDRVVDVRNVEVRVNETSWEPVSSSNYQLDGTDLTVQLGDVAAGSTTEVRATGSKVRVTDGAITVLDPTTSSDSLDTRVQVDSAGTNFSLAVDETIFADRVHYAENATWGETTGETTVTADGAQTLTLPDATAGAEATVRTWPVEVAPTTGEATVSDLEGSRTEPGIAVNGDGNSEVAYTFVDAADNTPYVLYSETNGIVRDSGMASSPITLTDDNSDETLVFLVDDGSASGTGSGSDAGIGGGVAPMEAAGGGFTALQALIPSGSTLLLGVALLGGLFVVGRRTGVVTEERTSAATSAAGNAAGTAGGLIERALDNQIVVGALILAAGAFVLGTGVLPEQTRIIVGLATAPVAMYLALQQFGEFDFRIWAGSTAIVALLGLNVLAPEFFQTIAEEAGIIIVVAAAYLGYLAISAYRKDASTPDEQTNVTFEVEDNEGNN